MIVSQLKVRAKNETVDLRAAEIDKYVHNEEEINDSIDDKEAEPSANHHLARRRVEIYMLLTQETDLKNACVGAWARGCVGACISDGRTDEGGGGGYLKRREHSHVGQQKYSGTVPKHAKLTVRVYKEPLP